MTFQGCSQICFVEPHLFLNLNYFLEAALSSVVFHAFTLCALVLKRKTLSLKCVMIRNAVYFMKNGELRQDFFFLFFCYAYIKSDFNRKLQLSGKMVFRSLTSKRIYKVFLEARGWFRFVVTPTYFTWLRVDYTQMLCRGRDGGGVSAS